MQPKLVAILVAAALMSTGAVARDTPSEPVEPRGKILSCPDLVHAGRDCPIVVAVAPGSRPECPSGHIMPSCKGTVAELMAIASLHGPCQKGQVEGAYRYYCSTAAAAAVILRHDVPNCFDRRTGHEPICWIHEDPDAPLPTLERPSYEGRHPGRVMAAT